MHLIKQIRAILEMQCVQDVAARPEQPIVVLVDLGMGAGSLWSGRGHFLRQPQKRRRQTRGFSLFEAVQVLMDHWRILKGQYP